MSTVTGTELSAESSACAGPGEELPPGLGRYRLAWRRLKRNRLALAFGGLFLAHRYPPATRRGLTRSLIG